MAVAYAIVIGFLEPFYVAAGFAMYLNRRAELEAWDVEQELRRAFAPLSCCSPAVVALAPLPAPGAARRAARPPANAPARDDVRKALDKVANDPNLAPERMVNMLRLAESPSPSPTSRGGGSG